MQGDHRETKKSKAPPSTSRSLGIRGHSQSGTAPPLLLPPQFPCSGVGPSTQSFMDCSSTSPLHGLQFFRTHPSAPPWAFTAAGKYQLRCGPPWAPGTTCSIVVTSQAAGEYLPWHLEHLHSSSFSHLGVPSALSHFSPLLLCLCISALS